MTESNVIEEKAEIRHSMTARRDAVPDATVKAAGSDIAALVTAHPAFVSAETVCCYMAIGNEVPTEPIIRAALAAGKRVVLPRTHFNPRRLTLHLVDNLEALAPGRYDIPEPSATAEEVTPETVDLFLVPGIAFDATGNRLGYGAGFYDGMLSESSGTRMALAYTMQVVPMLPVDAYDVGMEFIATECGVIDCRQAQCAGDRLRLRNLQCYGYHGAFPQERAHGIRLAFDIDMRLDLQLAGLTDDLHATVNYPAVYKLIDRIQSSREFHLLEALAIEVAQGILTEFTAVHEVSVIIRKFNPPIGGLLDAFEVEITRSRSFRGV